MVDRIHLRTMAMLPILLFQAVSASSLVSLTAERNAVFHTPRSEDQDRLVDDGLSFGLEMGKVSLQGLSPQPLFRNGKSMSRMISGSVVSSF